NDVLDFSKIEAGKLELRNEPCNLRHLVEEVVDLFAARAHLKRIELVCHAEPGLPHYVEADRDRLRQVLSNLLGNAVKFTEQGQIVLRARREAVEGADPRVRFEVRSEEHTSELQSRENLVCRLLLEKKKTREVWSRARRQTTSRAGARH